MPGMEKKSLGEFMLAGSSSGTLDLQLQEVIKAGQLLSWCPSTAQVLLTVTKQGVESSNMNLGTALASVLEPALPTIPCDKQEELLRVYCLLQQLADQVQHLPLQGKLETHKIMEIVSYWETLHQLHMSIVLAWPAVAGTLLQRLGPSLFSSVLRPALLHLFRQTRCKALNILLERCSARDRVLFKDATAQLFSGLPGALREAGDYDFQTCLVEALFRLSSTAERNANITVWFPQLPCTHHALFTRIVDFDPDCRRFLNAYNSQLGRARTVHTFAASSATIGAVTIHKPRVTSYEQLWVDFNLGSGAVSLLCDKADPSVPSAERQWETLTVYADEVISGTLRTSLHGLTLVLELDRPVIEFFSPLQQPSQRADRLADPRPLFRLAFDSAVEEFESIALQLYGEKLRVERDLPPSTRGTPRRRGTPARRKASVSADLVRAAATPHQVGVHSHPSCSPSEAPGSASPRHLSKDPHGPPERLASPPAVTTKASVNAGALSCNLEHADDDAPASTADGDSEEVISPSLILPGQTNLVENDREESSSNGTGSSQAPRLQAPVATPLLPSIARSSVTGSDETPTGQVPSPTTPQPTVLSAAELRLHPDHTPSLVSCAVAPQRSHPLLSVSASKDDSDSISPQHRAIIATPSHCASATPQRSRKSCTAALGTRSRTPRRDRSKHHQNVNSKSSQFNGCTPDHLHICTTTPLRTKAAPQPLATPFQRTLPTGLGDAIFLTPQDARNCAAGTPLAGPPLGSSRVLRSTGSGQLSTIYPDSSSPDGPQKENNKDQPAFTGGKDVRQLVPIVQKLDFTAKDGSTLGACNFIPAHYIESLDAAMSIESIQPLHTSVTAMNISTTRSSITVEDKKPSRLCNDIKQALQQNPSSDEDIVPPTEAALTKSEKTLRLVSRLSLGRNKNKLPSEDLNSDDISAVSSLTLNHQMAKVTVQEVQCSALPSDDHGLVGGKLNSHNSLNVRQDCREIYETGEENANEDPLENEMEKTVPEGNALNITYVINEQAENDERDFKLGASISKNFLFVTKTEGEVNTCVSEGLPNIDVGGRQPEGVEEHIAMAADADYDLINKTSDGLPKKDGWEGRQLSDLGVIIGKATDSNLDMCESIYEGVQEEFDREESSKNKGIINVHAAYAGGNVDGCLSGRPKKMEEATVKTADPDSHVNKDLSDDDVPGNDDCGKRLEVTSRPGGERILLSMNNPDKHNVHETDGGPVEDDKPWDNDVQCDARTNNRSETDELRSCEPDLVSPEVSTGSSRRKARETVAPNVTTVRGADALERAPKSCATPSLDDNLCVVRKKRSIDCVAASAPPRTRRALEKTVTVDVGFGKRQRKKARYSTEGVCMKTPKQSNRRTPRRNKLTKSPIDIVRTKVNNNRCSVSVEGGDEMGEKVNNVRAGRCSVSACTADGGPPHELGKQAATKTKKNEPPSSAAPADRKESRAEAFNPSEDCKPSLALRDDTPRVHACEIEQPLPLSTEHGRAKVVSTDHVVSHAISCREIVSETFGPPAVLTASNDILTTSSNEGKLIVSGLPSNTAASSGCQDIPSGHQTNAATNNEEPANSFSHHITNATASSGDDGHSNIVLFGEGQSKPCDRHINIPTAPNKARDVLSGRPVYCKSVPESQEYTEVSHLKFVLVDYQSQRELAAFASSVKTDASALPQISAATDGYSYAEAVRGSSCDILLDISRENTIPPSEALIDREATVEDLKLVATSQLGRDQARVNKTFLSPSIELPARAVDQSTDKRTRLQQTTEHTLIYYDGECTNDEVTDSQIFDENIVDYLDDVIPDKSALQLMPPVADDPDAFKDLQSILCSKVLSDFPAGLNCPDGGGEVVAAPLSTTVKVPLYRVTLQLSDYFEILELDLSVDVNKSAQPSAINATAFESKVSLVNKVGPHVPDVTASSGARAPPRLVTPSRAVSGRDRRSSVTSPAEHSNNNSSSGGCKSKAKKAKRELPPHYNIVPRATPVTFTPVKHEHNSAVCRKKLFDATAYLLDGSPPVEVDNLTTDDSKRSNFTLGDVVPLEDSRKELLVDEQDKAAPGSVKTALTNSKRGRGRSRKSRVSHSKSKTYDFVQLDEFDHIKTHDEQESAHSSTVRGASSRDSIEKLPKFFKSKEVIALHVVPPSPKSSTRLEKSNHHNSVKKMNHKRAAGNKKTNVTGCAKSRGFSGGSSESEGLKLSPHKTVFSDVNSSSGQSWLGGVRSKRNLSKYTRKYSSKTVAKSYLQSSGEEYKPSDKKHLRQSQRNRRRKEPTPVYSQSDTNSGDETRLFKSLKTKSQVQITNVEPNITDRRILRRKPPTRSYILKSSSSEFSVANRKNERSFKKEATDARAVPTGWAGKVARDEQSYEVMRECSQSSVDHSLLVDPVVIDSKSDNSINDNVHNKRRCDDHDQHVKKVKKSRPPKLVLSEIKDAEELNLSLEEVSKDAATSKSNKPGDEVSPKQDYSGLSAFLFNVLSKTKLQKGAVSSAQPPPPPANTPVANTPDQGEGRDETSAEISRISAVDGTRVATSDGPLQSTMICEPAPEGRVMYLPENKGSSMNRLKSEKTSVKSEVAEGHSPALDKPLDPCDFGEGSSVEMMSNYDVIPEHPCTSDSSEDSRRVVRAAKVKVFKSRGWKSSKVKPFDELIGTGCGESSVIVPCAVADEAGGNDEAGVAIISTPAALTTIPSSVTVPSLSVLSGTSSPAPARHVETGSAIPAAGVPSHVTAVAASCESASTGGWSLECGQQRRFPDTTCLNTNTASSTPRRLPGRVLFGSSQPALLDAILEAPSLSSPPPQSEDMVMVPRSRLILLQEMLLGLKEEINNRVPVIIDELSSFLAAPAAPH